MMATLCGDLSVMRGATGHERTNDEQAPDSLASLSKVVIFDSCLHKFRLGIRVLQI